MLSKNIDVWNIVFYDEVTLINKLYFYNIEIYKFKKIDEYKFCFETLRKNRNKIKKNFKQSKIVKKRGILNHVESILVHATFICIVLASISMYNVSKRIWKIEIHGDYKGIEETLKEELVKHDLVISKYYPNDDKLKEIENDITLYLSKEIEFLELKRKGAIISLRYQKRRMAEPLDSKGNNLYATKDGMVKYFTVFSGVKQVKEYDYVRKGDLLVKDVVETSSGELINVGTIGSVFANTFYIIDVSLNHNNEDEAVIFSKMLDSAKRKISTYLSKDEKIEIERVLNYFIDEKSGKMKVYYMLLEDITI